MDQNGHPESDCSPLAAPMVFRVHVSFQRGTSSLPMLGCFFGGQTLNDNDLTQNNLAWRNQRLSIVHVFLARNISETNSQDQCFKKLLFEEKTNTTHLFQRKTAPTCLACAFFVVPASVSNVLLQMDHGFAKMVKVVVL